MPQTQEIKDQKIMDDKDMSKNNNKDESIESVPLFRKKGVVIPALIILIAAAAGIYWYIGQMGYVSTDDAFIDGDKLSVSSKILGRITDLTVDEGDTVKQGQLLVQLSSSDLQAQQDQAKANLNLAKESISLAQVNVTKAQDDFDRADQQYKDKIIPKEQYDHAQKALEAAKAELNIDQAKIKTYEAQLNVIKTDFENTSIYATMNGVIGKKWVLKGDVVQPGQPIFTMFDLKNLWVTADLEETKLSSIHIGDKAEISVDAYPDQIFEGIIYQLGSNTASQFSLIPPSNASGNFTKVTQRVPIKISINPVNAMGQPDPSENVKLLPGMSAEIKVKVKQ
jgi:membrane fusion protein, multidrug efflux system